MAIPKENRQQMINMMYIVLTALLALNVSAELLNAFSLINKSLENSSETIDYRNKAIYNSFADKKQKEPANKDVQIYEAKAIQIKALSEQLQGFIQNLNDSLFILGDGEDPMHPGDMKKRGDVELSSSYLVEGNTKGNIKSGRGYELKLRIEDTYAKMLKLVDPADLKDQIGRLPLKVTSSADGKIELQPNKVGNDWVRESFYKIPAIAATAMLTKFKSDIQATEGQLSSYMYSKIGDAQVLKADEIVFDKFAAKIVAPTSYVMLGETFEAEIFLAAFNSKSQNVSISVNGGGLPVNSDGVAFYKRAATSVGEFPVSGTISVKNDRTGQSNSYKLPEFKYTVAAPFATVNPTKMNVFYIGVDNPVEVSAAGVRATDLNVSMSAGSISGSGGKYTVRVSGQGKTTVNVNAKGKNLASTEFRVKMIPDPIAEVGGKSEGPMAAAAMRAQNGLSAVLKNFDFDARFEVVSYQVTYLPRRQDPVSAQVTGPYFNQAVKGFQSSMKPGDTVYFEEIRVKGPDGTTRKIPGIVFKLN